VSTEQPRTCSECGADISDRSAQARTCSPGCLRKRSRRLAAGGTPEPPEQPELTSENAELSPDDGAYGGKGGYGEQPQNLPNLQPPELLDGALSGLPGDVVRTIAPHTEGWPAALLVSYLTMLGNAMGPQPSVSVGADKHPGRLFSLVVGDSATGRKGTAGSEVERVFVLAEPEWYGGRLERGIQSAESIVARADNRISHDPRLLLTEFEFGRLLAVMRLRPNLTSVLKEAYDGRPLAVATKDPRNRRSAVGAHISIIGHVTASELSDRLTAVDIDSGFGNRFLYCVAARSQLLPRGGALPEDDLEKLADRTSAAVQFAHELALRDLDLVSRELCAYHGVYPQVELQRTAGFWEMWDRLYTTDFERRLPGTAGAVTSRAPSQVLRLAVIFALADLSASVDVAHLNAAAAVWEYCRHSAVAVFGTMTGNRDADRVLRALRNAPMTRNDIYVMLGRSRSRKQMDDLIGVLTGTGLVRSTVLSTSGRPGTTYTYKLEET
jgi:Protein of unknown function (DUF3987)